MIEKLSTTMIPRKIHYCWFGGKLLPELAQKCIASWKKFLPDYEIIEWNEGNYAVRKIPYMARVLTNLKNTISSAIRHIQEGR